MSLPGVLPDVKEIDDKQRHLQKRLEYKEKQRILQQLSQIGGIERRKEWL